MAGIGRSALSGDVPGGKVAGGKGAAGRTRSCPHCKATILDSASVCPGCRHHLRFDPGVETERRAAATFSPLTVEGRIRHPAGAEPWEYSVVLSIRNERGEEVTRQVVGVGALRDAGERSFTLDVQVMKPPGDSTGRK
jgi:hypothetical protein